MRRSLLAALTTNVAVAYAYALARDSSEPHTLRTRNIVDSIAEEYDFVIVGGGLAGLVLGARLSEDKNHTVLVLEAGGNGDDYRERIDTPGDAYYNSLWQTPLNWAFTTVPQSGANNTKCEWPRGKVLGGSSAINGLYMNRPGVIEVNAWQSMLGDMDGADNWSWDSLFAAMKKSETFTPPTGNIAQEGGIAWDASSHGTSGPIHMSWPGYQFALNGQWTSATQSAGVADSGDTYGGENWGSYISMSCINPTNWTRSYSRSGYLDPLPPRPNYDVLANAQVTRILFNSSSPATNLTANAVEYSPDGGATKLTVKVNKEVVLAGGTIGSPTVLMHSGVGPKDVLDAAGVTVLSDLPGVGQHLQDHISVSMSFSTNQDTAGSIYKNGNNDPAFLSYVDDAVAYVNGSALFGAGLSDLESSIGSDLSSYSPSQVSDQSVIAGYKAIYEVTAKTIVPSPLGLIELLMGNNLEDEVRIGASLQHPFSHGQITINTPNPMDYPLIDPAYLTHPADVEILREGLKLVRRIANTGAMSNQLQKETWPGTNVNTDAEWETWMRNNIFTEYHPSSTCSMLPLEQGGVVDANLRVYGLANVRVADASVPPMSFSAHLMSSTYGIAEQASTIIREYHNRKITKTTHNSTSTATSSHGTHSSTSSAQTSNSNGSNGKSNDGVAASAVRMWPMVLAAALAVVFEIAV